MEKPLCVLENSVKSDVALSYIPAILFKLDADTTEMFACVLQAMRDGGYEDGFKDGQFDASKCAK